MIAFILLLFCQPRALGWPKYSLTAGSSLPDVSTENSEDTDEVEMLLSNLTRRSPLVDICSSESSTGVVDLECEWYGGERLSKV
jgi:hypothetical protein